MDSFLFQKDFKQYKSLPALKVFCKEFGFGKKLFLKIVAKLQVNKQFCIGDLSEDQQTELLEFINSNEFFLMDSLKKYVFDNIQKLKQLRSYRGLRHLYNLPTRGQRTRSNAKNRKYLVNKND